MSTIFSDINDVIKVKGHNGTTTCGSIITINMKIRRHPGTLTGRASSRLNPTFMFLARSAQLQNNCSDLRITIRSVADIPPMQIYRLQWRDTTVYFFSQLIVSLCKVRKHNFIRTNIQKNKWVKSPRFFFEN